MDFSDVDNASGEVGGEVQEVESKDSDFGDGDGVNDFDDTYNEMNSGNETMEYSSDSDGDGTTSDGEKGEFETTDGAVDGELEDFDDSSDTAVEQEVQAPQDSADNVEQSSNLNTDESVDDALSDFDDSADGEQSGDSAESTENVDVAEDGEASGNDVEETGDASEDQPEEVVDADTDNTEDVDTTADEETAESGSEETGEVSDTNETQPEDSADDSAESTENVDVAEDGEASRNDVEETGEANDASEDQSEEAVDADTDNTEDVDTTADEETAESGSEETGEVSDTYETRPEDSADDSTESTENVDVAEDGEASGNDAEESSEASDASEDQPEEVVDADTDNTEDVDTTVDEETSEGGLEETSETSDASEDQPEEVVDADTDNTEGVDTTANEETSESGSEETGEVSDTNETKPEDSVDDSVESTENDSDEAGESTDTTESQPEELQENAENASNYANSEANQSTDVNDGTNSNGEDTLDGDIPKPENDEKTAMFENVSYHQGQNDFGARGTCGPTSIANSLNRVTGTSDYTENAVLHNAMDNDLCSKSWNPNAMGGTTTDNVVSIIDNVKNPDSNIHTEVYEYDKALSVDELADKVDNPGTVAMVGVDSATLWDQRGDVVSSGLFQHTEAPSDHWITVDSPTRDSDGNVTGFNIIDSGGGVDYVNRDKFEAMYQGDASHTVSDPTAIIISNQGEVTNIYETTDGVERTSNYKGSAVESDGGAPPSEVEDVKIRNTEKTLSGSDLSDEQKEVNQYFRGDQYSAKDSFESSIESDRKEQLVSANCSTTCEFNANLDGALDSNAKYSAKMSDAQMTDVKELKELRDNVPAVTEDTVMQKVISPDQFAEYTSVDSPKTQVTGCASRATDVAPYTNNMEQAYETLRLDYNGTCYKEPAENGGDMYVMRFTSEYCPGNEEYPKMDGSQPWNKPPCTGTGYTGSSEHLVPEYTYGRGQDITDGAIYKVDKDGNETMVAMWNHGRFEKVE